jgi:4-amino-4-deoxy-L-arabinose transferase-like glycosyltransferase
MKTRLVVILTILAGVILGAANLVMGDLNQDEGWYLYAAQRVAEGWVLYKDFAFTQGPVLPKVYALFIGLIDAGGVGAGRAITWVFGFISAILAASVARWLGGKSAGAIALILILVNVYHSYFTTVVKTYALSAFFIMLGLAALAKFINQRRALWLVLAGLALAAAAGTRLSLGILLAVSGLWLLFGCKQWGRLSWLYFGAGGAFGLALIFLPAYLAAPDGFLFGVIEFHTLRDSGSFLSGLIYKAGFISRLILAYTVAVGLIAFMAVAKFVRPFACATDTGYHQTDAIRLVRLMWMWMVAVTLVHIAAPFPYDDYQVPIFPVLATALAVSWSYALRAWSGSGYRWAEGVEPTDPPVTRWFVWSLLVVSAAAAISSPVNQDWMIAGRDRIWWKVKEKPALLQLREVAAELRGMAPHGILITQDTYLAVEAGLHVPLGWEMGPFSYYPDLDDESARRLGLLNKNRVLHDLMTSHAEVAAFSGYGLSIASPDVSPLDDETRANFFGVLESRYELFKEVPRFGQASTTLKLYHMREPHDPGHHH